MIDIQSDYMYLAYLAQPLFVGQRWYVGAQPLERLVDALHAASLAKISSLTLLGHLGSALQASRLVTSPTTKEEREREIIQKRSVEVVQHRIISLDLRLLVVLLIAVETTAIRIVIIIALRAVLISEEVFGAGVRCVCRLRTFEEVACHGGLQIEIVHGKHYVKC